MEITSPYQRIAPYDALNYLEDAANYLEELPRLLHEIRREDNEPRLSLISGQVSMRRVFYNAKKICFLILFDGVEGSNETRATLWPSHAARFTRRRANNDRINVVSFSPQSERNRER